MEIQEIRTFGRRHGKKLSLRQQSLVDNLLPAILPKNDEKTGILEIGFGGGEHLIELSARYPETLIIGAEPFMNGVASLLSKITDENEHVLKEYQNIRIWPDDVRKFLETSNIKFSQIYVLHPDPWPKVRHEKRRLLSSKFLNEISKYLAQNGQIILGTDHWGYYEWVLEQVKNTNLTSDQTDMEIIKTRYQEKNKAGTLSPKYLILTNQ